MEAFISLKPINTGNNNKYFLSFIILLVFLMNFPMGVSTQGAPYIGCFHFSNNNVTSGHADNQSNLGNSTELTIQQCRVLCIENKHTFFGLMDHDTCFCYKFLHEFGDKISDDNCYYECSGHNIESCGGNNSISIYSSCDHGYYGIRHPYCSFECPENRCINKFSGNVTLDIYGLNKLCNVESGDCLTTDSCENGWSGYRCMVKQQCEVIKTRADLMLRHSNFTNRFSNYLNDVIGYWFNTQILKSFEHNEMMSMVNTSFAITHSCYIFPTLRVKTNGHVNKIEFYASVNGTVFISFWNVFKENMGSVHSEYLAEFCGRIRVSTVQGYNVIQIEDRFEVFADNSIGMEFKSSQNDVLPIMVNQSTVPYSHLVMLPLLISNQTTFNWTIGAIHRFIGEKLLFQLISSSNAHDQIQQSYFAIDIPLRITTKCNASCPVYTYGQFCQHVCGHCDDNVTCHHKNGMCPNSCANDWTGPYCTENQNGRSENNDSTVSIDATTDLITELLVTANEFNTTIGDTNTFTTTEAMDSAAVDNSVSVTVGLAVGIIFALLILVLVIVLFTRCEANRKFSNRHADEKEISLKGTRNNKRQKGKNYVMRGHVTSRDLYA